MAKYAYDAWGRVVYSTGSMATVNPIRYRGYYYDAELEMYYLQSRYYDPATKRFINADGYASTGQEFLGYNMFSYCLNNPVNLTDGLGLDPIPSWAKRIINGTASLVDYRKALSINPNSWAGTARYYVNQAVSLAEKYYRVLLYQEHHKKGSTNPSNRNKHENGQTRRQRDSSGEKGDSRRTSRSNKRRPSNIVAEKITAGLMIIGGVIAFGYLAGNDITGIGTADDVLLPGAVSIIWDGIEKMFS